MEQPSSSNQIFHHNAPDVLQTLHDSGKGSVDLIYIDPPFNTGKVQQLGDKSYSDSWESHEAYMAWISSIFDHCYLALKDTGSFFLHIDYRASHYCKVALDNVFGPECFMNEIIWAYDYGGRSKKKWSSKHDSIFWYVMDPKNYTFNYDEMDRIPYMAPGLVGKEKAARGKTPTDVWWHTIVPTNGKERTGYPTQKPLGVLERIVKVHSNPGDLCVDVFAGSGTLGEAAAKNNRRFLLADTNFEAINVMMDRLCEYLPLERR